MNKCLQKGRTSINLPKWYGPIHSSWGRRLEERRKDTILLFSLDNAQQFSDRHTNPSPLGSRAGPPVDTWGYSLLCLPPSLDTAPLVPTLVISLTCSKALFRRQIFTHRFIQSQTVQLPGYMVHLHHPTKHPFWMY